MLFKEVIAIYTENDLKPTNTLRGQNAEVLKQVVHVVTAGL
jgi:hypothetical protein